MAQASSTPAVSPRPRPRYREERTLVRKLLPRPGQSKQEFRENVKKLRKAFLQFNADVSGVCQWAIQFRPRYGKPAEPTETFWKFFLEPETFLPPNDSRSPEFRRLQAFEAATGINGTAALDDPAFTNELRDSILAVASRPKTKEAQRLFSRLKGYQPAHRMILAKVAAEWIESRYRRAHQNWERNYEEWKKEKQEWEQNHPELTPEIREAFNQIFQQLDVKEKRVRICPAARLLQNKDNCQYAGKNKHSVLCNQFNEFKKNHLQGKAIKFFYKDAEKYLRCGLQSLKPNVQGPFRKDWNKYLRYMNLKEATLRGKNGGRLPHCKNLGQECEFNPHTALCKQYQQQLSSRPDLVQHDELYRKWRREYWREPRKPVFCYPSVKRHSIAKIFGENYFQADFKNSVVGLRLDSMPAGQYLEFAFAPWPRNYRPQPGETEISSVHLHFVGTRPRIGFRFRVPHKRSRFGCTQEELDELRSRTFPRKAQDQKFLEAARKRLLETFPGNAEQELRLLAVDLGTDSARAAFFIGKTFQQAFPLKIVKIEKLYEQWPNQKQAGDRRDASSKQPRPGLSRDHVGRHLQKMRAQASEIAQKRQELTGTPAPETTTDQAAKKATLQPFDLRGLTVHTARMIRDWARLNARQIIQLAEENQVDLIVLESLRGFRPPGYENLDQEKKRRVAFFAHGRIRRKVTEKAVERGMRVVTVPYLASSKVCAECRKKQKDNKQWEKNKKRGLFKCEGCGSQAQVDENAARVLGRVFWGEIELPTAIP